VEPWGKEVLDLAAPARRLEPSLDGLLLDNDERGNVVDVEALEQVRVLSLLDAVEVEGPVVLPALEHLREEPFGSAACAGAGRVEVDEAGSVAVGSE